MAMRFCFRFRRRTTPLFVLLLLSLLAFWVLRSEGILLRYAKVDSSLVLYATEAEKCNALMRSVVSETNFDDRNRQRIIDRIQLIRLYGHCYLRNDFPAENVQRAEELLFPALKFSPLEEKKTANGRGIIMSLGETGLIDFQNLIRVLDLLGNELPIEVFHKNDVPQHFLDSLDFGQQNVEFVDASSFIPTKHKARYKRFVNKWLPVLLNSFEEFIFMDSDVVPFVKPEELFHTRQYVESGSHFFRDRAYDQRLGSADVLLYKHLMPSSEESSAFSMPQIDSRNITFLKHRMESGVVVLNKKKYLPGLLVAASMQFWEPTALPVWGDKELFWMGQMISGEEGFQFSKYNAGSLGAIEKEVDEKTKLQIGNRTCSIQMAHFDDDLNLLWINGGLRHCKLGSWDKDWRKQESLRKKYSTKEEMKKDFLSFVKPNGVIIPPKTPLSWRETFQTPHHGFRMNKTMGCSGYNWCAYDTKTNPGITIEFNKEQQTRMDMILDAWSQRSRLDGHLYSS